MNNKRRANRFFFIITLLYILNIFFMGRVYRKLNLSSLDITWISEYLFLLIPSIIFVLVHRFYFKEIFSLKKVSFWNLVCVFIIALFSQPIMGFIANLTQVFFKDLGGSTSSYMATTSYPYLMFVIAVTPAICEEAVMRGIVFSGYKREKTFILILMNGLYFGLLHLNPSQFFYACFAGILFSYILKITGSIFTTSLFHFIHNGLSVTLYKIMYNFYNKDTLSGSYYMGTRSKIIQLFFQYFMAAVCVLVIYFVLKQLKKYNEDLEKKKSPPLEVEVNSQATAAAVPLEDKTKVFDIYVFLSIAAYVLFLIIYCVLTHRSIFQF